MKERDDIGDFFKAELDNFEPSLSFDELEIIDKIQANNRFYKFSPYNFNIFYALAIVSGFLLTLGCVTHYILKQQNDVSTIENLSQSKKTSKIIPIVNESAKIVEKKNISSTSQGKTNTSEKPKNNTSKLESNNIETTTPTVPQTTNVDLTPQIVTKPISITDSIPKKVEIKPIRKKIFIVKRDTIYKKDTLKIKHK